ANLPPFPYTTLFRSAAAGIRPCRRSRLPIAIMLAIGGAHTGVYAQDGADGVLEEVISTGSRIRTSGMDTPNPVTVVTREEIDIRSEEHTSELQSREN